MTRFDREAQSATKLTHPNIVDVFDTGSHEDIHYVAVEYVEGDTLAEVLDHEGLFSVDGANNIATGVADALSVAHRQGMVHGDLNPANILITADGTVKVADFGIARFWPALTS